MEQKGDCKNESPNKILDWKKMNVVLFHPKEILDSIWRVKFRRKLNLNPSNPVPRIKWKLTSLVFQDSKDFFNI